MTAKITFVAGARPNFMKVAPVLRALEAHRNTFGAELVHTGQHYDPGMSSIFFDQLGVPPPDRHLNVGSGTHGEMTARVLEAFERHLIEAPPRGVVVVGDVNSTMAAALAAVKLGIPVAHVEAGLRSFDRSMPEEINRVVTDAVADLLLVSEPSGEANLLSEGIPRERMSFVGNVMIDTLVRELTEAKALGTPRAMGLESGGFALVTLHRPSNVDDPDRLRGLVELLSRLGSRLSVVFPAHPRTHERLERADLLEPLQASDGLHYSEPIGYREMLGLMAEAKLVITDSGGIQEETAYLKVPCLTIRPNTERPVTVTHGTNTVVEDLAQIGRLVDDVLGGRYKTGQPIPKWDGHAAERVVEALVDAWA